MKYLVILCTFLFSLSANAHTIKGKITGLKDGTIVYLLTHSDDKIGKVTQWRIAVMHLESGL